MGIETNPLFYQITILTVNFMFYWFTVKLRTKRRPTEFDHRNLAMLKQQRETPEN